jgi:AcrR family transcriptional regulator
MYGVTIARGLRLSIQYCMVKSMTERLTAQDWIDFALKTLAHAGFEALKADVLARKLGITRGSFYWHFNDLGAFHTRVIEHWKLAATEAIIVDIERYASPEQRMEALLRHAFGHGASLELRMRIWAASNTDAARAVGEIDRRRRDYIENLLMEAGIAPEAATTRAQLVYWSYLGAALSQTRLKGERLDRTVAEVKRIGLGGVDPEVGRYVPGQSDRSQESQ